VTGALVVVTAGIASTVQDLGRPGLAHIGVTRSGCVDPALGALVNRLVGNPAGAALLETCGGLTVEARGAVVVATSTELAPRTLRNGERVNVPGGGDRLWHYLAVRGGFDVAVVLGSRASDTLSGIGPPPLTDGSVLPVGDEPVTPINTDKAPLAARATTARIAPGPRRDWFVDDALARLCAAPLTVTTSSRIGVRLSGVDVPRVRTGELASEGLVRGAIQVPPDGDPVMMLADHPTTGGYPVIAVVQPDDVAVIAQIAPGGQIRLVAR
jgi:biotin-dependent carboxylase-like uncharacterized protein